MLILYNSKGQIGALHNLIIELKNSYICTLQKKEFF